MGGVLASADRVTLAERFHALRSALVDAELGAELAEVGEFDVRVVVVAGWAELSGADEGAQLGVMRPVDTHSQGAYWSAVRAPTASSGVESAACGPGVGIGIRQPIPIAREPASYGDSTKAPSTSWTTQWWSRSPRASGVVVVADQLPHFRARASSTQPEPAFVRLATSGGRDA